MFPFVGLTTLEFLFSCVYKTEKKSEKSFFILNLVFIGHYGHVNTIKDTKLNQLFNEHITIPWQRKVVTSPFETPESMLSSIVN